MYTYNFKIITNLACFMLKYTDTVGKTLGRTFDHTHNMHADWETNPPRAIDSLLAICCSSGCSVASGIIVIGGVCNCSQMRTSKCTCLIFGVSIGLDPGWKYTKGIFDRSWFKVTRGISPTISGWLLV